MLTIAGPFTKEDELQAFISSLFAEFRPWVPEDGTEGFVEFFSGKKAAMPPHPFWEDVTPDQIVVEIAKDFPDHAKQRLIWVVTPTISRPRKGTLAYWRIGAEDINSSK